MRPDLFLPDPLTTHGNCCIIVVQGQEGAEKIEGEYMNGRMRRRFNFFEKNNKAPGAHSTRCLLFLEGEV